MKARSILLVLLLGACTRTPPAVHPAPATSDSARFFRNLPYGTDDQFNPISVFLNHGFDQLRTSPRTDFTRYPYRASVRAVLRSVFQPDRSIRRYGYGNWLRNEVFPLTLRSSGGGQWYPNYTLHLFGNGVTYVRLIDWYAQHDVPDARLVAGATTYAYHLLVETMENGPHANDGVDALTDLLIFDSASLLLWNTDAVRRFFSGPVEVNDWYGQVSLGIPGRTIENASSMVMARVRVPGTQNWKIMVTHGSAFVLGVSRRIGSGDWLTIGSGADAPANPVIDERTGKKSATLEPNAALFYDRNGSLLVSLISRGGSDNGPTLNVYPGVITLGPVRPAFWIQENRGGGARFGVSGTLGVGLSTSAKIRKR